MTRQYDDLRDIWKPASPLPLGLSGPRATAVPYRKDPEKPLGEKGRRLFLTGQSGVLVCIKFVI